MPPGGAYARHAVTGLPSSDKKLRRLMHRAFHLLTLGMIAALGAAVVASGRPAAPAIIDRQTPTAITSNGSPIVGALFAPGSSTHGCTATVINAHTGDLVLTAAHCVTGTGVGWRFAPNWHHGIAPDGTWIATAAYALPGWLQHQDPQLDMAMLKVAPQRIDGRERTLQSVTGAADIGRAPRTGQQIREIAYNNNAQTPIECTATTYWTRGHPSFDCHGYVSGSSGSPWLVTTGPRPQVVGLVGGLYQGGCDEATSYSSAFGKNIVDLWLTAEASLHSETLPVPDPDGC